MMKKTGHVFVKRKSQLCFPRRIHAGFVAGHPVYSAPDLASV